MSTLSLDGIKTEGGLLPAELLQRVSALDRELPGLAATDYDILGHERVLEAAGRAWTRLVPAYHRFREALTAAPDAQRTSLTRQRWLLPLFQELGYGRLEPARLERDGTRVPISHAWAATPIHLLGWATSLDTRTAKVAGAATASPHGLVQDFLNRSDGHLWGMVTNGQLIRILRDHLSLTRQAFVEFDLEQIFDAERYASFLTLWLIAHESRLRPRQRPATLRSKPDRVPEDSDDEDADLGEEDDGGVEEVSPDLVPAECWLERWHKIGMEQGIRAHKQLRNSVKEAIEILGTGFLAHRDNTALRAELASGNLDPQSYYRHVLRLVYRLIFLFVAEDRGLLVDTDAPDAAQDRYRRWYSTQRLRKLAQTVRGGAHGDAWRALRRVMALLGVRTGPDGQVTGGEPSLALPALGSWLWDDAQALGVIAASELANNALFRALRLLTLVRDEGRGRARGTGAQYPVDWRHIGADELGSVYESLLELRPDIENATGRLASFVLKDAAGNDRKTTGSYYTPESLVNCLLDTALVPVIDRARRAEDPKQALLALKVCDPACGSGHFLVAAGRRIARAVAQVETGDLEPSPAAVQSAMRDVVGHCLFGVDLNPMAVELCKVSLWMEGMRPSRPLSFLDHHIQHGNALFGATPKGIADGIPDDAFKAIEGDDPDVAKELRKRNREESKAGAQQQTFAGDLFGNAGAPSIDHARARATALEANSDRTIAEVQARREEWEAIRHDPGLAHASLVADMWCAAFIWPKRPGELSHAAPTHGAFVRLRDGRAEASPQLRRWVDRLRETHTFFHWHLAFPSVFAGTQDCARHAVTGWTGGFDVVLGNPPWDTLSPDAKEFFSQYEPEIRFQSPDAQKAMIADLVLDDVVAAKWESHRRVLYSAVHFMKASGRYTLFSPGNLGKGDFNAYRTFVEIALRTIRTGGRAAQVVPDGIYSGANCMAIRQELFGGCKLDVILGFENQKEIWFDGIDSRTKFAIYGAERPGTTESFRAAFNIRSPGELSFALSDAALQMPVRLVKTFSPDALAVMEFRGQRDIDIATKMYVRYPKFGDEEAGPPHRHYMAEIHMGNDRALFTEDPTGVPVYEGRMVTLYDHRAKGYRSGRGRKAVWEELPFSNPSKSIQPQWHIPTARLPAKLRERYQHYRVGFCDVASPTNERTLVATLIPPHVVCGDKVPTISFPNHPYAHLTWLAVANSFVMDFLARMKVSLKMSYTVLDSLPFARLNGTESALKYMLPRAARLSCTAPEMIGFWNKLAEAGWVARQEDDQNVPGALAIDERRALEAELNAFVAREVFGLSKEELSYVLDSFPIVRKRDIAAYGTYRTKALILDAYESLSAPSAKPPSDSFARIESIPNPPAPGGVPEPFWLIWALLRANRGEMTRLELARAFSLLAQPELLIQYARGPAAGPAREWIERANHDRFLQGALRAALDDLASRRGVAFAQDGTTVTVTEHTAAADRVPEWYRFEARLALAVLAEMPAAGIETVDAQVSDDDRKVVRLRGA